jgi:NADH-quinone oxidoreductase chain I
VVFPLTLPSPSGGEGKMVWLMSTKSEKTISYRREAINTVVSIVKGHIVTFRNLFRKKVTMQYPEVRWELPAGYRGAVSLPVDPDTGKDLCIGCQACVRVCPTQLLTVDTHMGEDKKRVVDAFHAEVERCLFCGLCEEVCPVDAIRMSKNYELAEFSRENLVYDRAKLNELGGIREAKPKPQSSGEAGRG